MTFPLRDERVRGFAVEAVKRAPLGKVVTIQEPTRTPEQNRLLWSLLQAVEHSQFEFCGRTWTAEDWKDIFLSAYLSEKHKETRFVGEGLAGEFLVLHPGTSRLSVAQFSELTSFILAFVDQNGIEWKERPPEPPEDPR